MSTFREPAPAPAMPPRDSPAGAPRVAFWLRLVLATALVAAGPLLALLEGYGATLNWGWHLALSALVMAVMTSLLFWLLRPLWQQTQQPLPWPGFPIAMLAMLTSWPLVSGIDHQLASQPPVTEIATVQAPVTSPGHSHHGAQLVGSVTLLLPGPGDFERRVLPAYTWMVHLEPGSRVRVTLQRGGLGLWRIVNVQPAEMGTTSGE